MNNKIVSFRELLNEIAYNWQYPEHDLFQDEFGNFYLDKLYIEPERVTYKLEVWDLEPGVFEDMKKFYEFLISTGNKE